MSPPNLLWSFCSHLLGLKRWAKGISILYLWLVFKFWNICAQEKKMNKCCVCVKQYFIFYLVKTVYLIRARGSECFFVCVCMLLFCVLCVCIYVCVQFYESICVCMLWMCVWVWVCLCMCVCVCVYFVCVFFSVYDYECVCNVFCVCVCVFVCVCFCI